VGDLLKLIGRDTLPSALVQQFITWCILQQARPALIIVLEVVGLEDTSKQIQTTDKFDQLLTLSTQANTEAKQLRQYAKTGPLGYSAAEAAAFEFTNMLNAARDAQFDAEAVAFFAARVCGWSGWAATQFNDPGQKAVAEAKAKQDQEQKLQHLWRQISLRLFQI